MKYKMVLLKTIATASLTKVNLRSGIWAFLRPLVMTVALLVMSFGLYAQTTYYSRASTAWNVNSTWSTVSHVSAVNTGTFPVAGDIVNIGGNFSVTISANAACATINIGDGSALAIGAANLTVSGATTVGGGTSGTLSITSNTGTKTFIGLVTINTGATWSNTTEGVTFRGGITNNGTFTAGTGVYLFNTNAQALTGTFVIPNITVTSPGALTSNNSLTIGATLAGTGSFTSVGTTIFSGTPTVLSGGGAKIFNDVTVNSGTILQGAVSLTVNGIFTNNGTINFTGGTVTLGGSSVTTLPNPSTTTFSALTLSTGPGASLTADAALTISGVLTINSGASITASSTSTVTKLTGNFVGTGSYISAGTTIFNGTIAMSGTGTKTFHDLIVNGTSLTPAANTSYTVTGSIDGTGALNDGSGTSSTTFDRVGTIPITGVGVKDFFDVVITSGTSVTYNTNISVNGATLVGTGNLTSVNAASVITFTSLAVSGAGTKDFANVTIATGASTTTSDITIRGNIVMTGSLVASAGTVTFAGTTAVSGAGASTFNNVLVNASSSWSSASSHTINGTFSNNGTINFTAGTLTLGASSVTTLTNPLASTTVNALTTLAGATVTDAATTNITITGNFAGGGTLTSLGTITFNGTVAMSGAGSKTFHNLVVNGTSLTPGANVSYTVTGSIDGTGILNDGSGTSSTTFDFNGGTIPITGAGVKDFFDVVITSGTSVTYNTNISVNGATLAGTGNLTSVNAASVITFTTVAISGAGAKDFANVTVATGASTLSGNFSVTGDITMTGSFVASAGTATFAGTTAVLGAGALTLNIVSVTSPNSLTLSPGTITVTGNLGNSGTINPGTGLLAFGGTSTITNTGTMSVNNVTINTASTMTAPSTVMSIAGVFTVTGTFNHNNGAIRFNTANAVASRLAGAGAKTFYDLDVTGTFNNTVSFTVIHNLSNSGTITCTAGTLTFGGTSIVTNAGTMDLFSATITAGNTMTAPVNVMSLAGVFTVSATGTFNTSAGTIQFRGANAANRLAGSTIAFSNLDIVGTFNNNVSFSVDEILSVSGAMNSTAGTATFGNVGAGTTPSISGGGTIAFNALTIAASHTLSTSSNISLAGTFTNSGANGAFTAGTNTVTFTGAAAQSITGNTVQFYDLTVNKSANSLAVSTAKSVTHTLTLTAGNLNITGSSLSLNSGATINLVAGTLGISSPAGGPWNLIYSGSPTITTGFEVPASGILTSLSETGSAAITLDQTLTVGAGGITISAGTFNSAANAISTAFLSINGGTFTAPSSTLTINSGDFSNSGTFTHNSGTVTFTAGNAQTISGPTSPQFNNLTLAGTGTKTFGVSIAITGVLSINSGANADLGTINTHTANSLVLNGVLQSATGTWGSGSSPADHTDNTYFSPSTGVITIAVGGTNYYSVADGDWSNPATWSTAGFLGTPGAGIPGAGDFVNIGRNGAGSRTVTITGTELCSALLFDAGTSVTNTVTISTGTLTVSGAVTIPQTITSGSNVFDVGPGALTAGSLDFTASGSGAGHLMTISTGTATISGNVTGIGASSTIQFTGGAGILQLGGSMFAPITNGTLTTVASSTVRYTGVAQTVQAFGYNNLTLLGSGSKTLAATTAVAGNLSVGTGTNFVVGAVTLTVTGTTTVAGTLSITSTTGGKTFAGLLTVNGTWTNSANENITLRGGISNAGTFTAGTGTYTFNTTPAQTLTGIFSMSTVSVASPTVLTNTNSLTVNTALGGTGRLTQGSNATLNIGGTSTITNMTATAPGNTVNYTGAAQAVKNVDYVNLGLSGSGTKTLALGTTAIAGNLTLSGATVSTTGATGLTIGGNVDIGLGSTFTAGAFTHTIAGNFMNNGTFIGTGSTINLNGVAQNISGVATSFNNLTLSGSGIKTLSTGVTSITGNLTLAGTASTTGVTGLTIGGSVDIGTGTSFTAGAFTHNVGGNWTSAGTFTHSNGTINFNGATQNISAGGQSFYNINLSNGSQATLSTALNLINVLQILSDNTALNSGGFLTLISTASNTAGIASLAGTGRAVNGNVTAQRYFDAADDTDRFISSPVSDGNVSELQAAQPAGSFPVTGDFPGTSFPCTGCNPHNGHSLRYYREADPGIINLGYKNWVTSSASALLPGVGYDAWMWNSVANTTVSFNGPINRDDINLGIVASPSPGTSITNTSANSMPEADGYNLVGNPYPSAIQWNDNTSHWTQSNIHNTILVWDVIGEVWLISDADNPTTGAGILPNGIIASGQGFWVYATAATGTLTVHEDAKSLTTSASYYRQTNKNGRPTLQVSLENSGVTDNAVIIIDQQATDKFDPGFDLPKLQLGIERMSVSLVDDKQNKLARLVVNNTSKDIPISVSGRSEGDYTLQFSNVNAFPKFEDYYLIDAYLGKAVKISDGPVAVTISSDARSFQDRFRLSLSSSVEDKNKIDAAVQVACFPNPTSSNLVIEVNSGQVQAMTLMDSMGKMVSNISYESSKGTTRGEVNVAGYSSGVYFVKVIVNGGLHVEKVLKY
jgi:hypothetical protein